MRLLIVAFALTAVLGVSVQAEAHSVGFCTFGQCGGIDIQAQAGFATVRVCENLGVPLVPACPVNQLVPHGLPTPPVPLAIGCNAVFPFAPPAPALPVGPYDTVVAFCL